MSKAKTRHLSNSSQAALPTKAAPEYSIRHPDTMPDSYVVHCSGTCLEPDVTDGAPVLIEKHGKIAPGDLVVLFFKPEHAPGGKYQAILKRLVLAPPPHVSFPWREHPQSDVHALIIVEMLNPHKQFAYKCEHLLGVHKCVGRVPESMTLYVKGPTYQTHAGETILSDAENNGGEITDPSRIAPPARTSRRDFLMNSIVSSASLATVTVVAPAIVNARSGDDAELLRLGGQLDHIGEEWLAKQLSDARCRATWEEACIKAGLPRLAFGSASGEEVHQRHSKRGLIYDGDRDEVDDHGASVVWNSIHDRLFPLVDEIFAYKAKTLDGLAVQTHATILANSSWWTAAAYEGEEGDRLFFESLCSYLSITPVVITFVRSPEFRAAYGDDAGED